MVVECADEVYLVIGGLTNSWLEYISGSYPGIQSGDIKCKMLQIFKSCRRLCPALSSAIFGNGQTPF